MYESIIIKRGINLNTVENFLVRYELVIRLFVGNLLLYLLLDNTKRKKSFYVSPEVIIYQY